MALTFPSTDLATLLHNADGGQSVVEKCEFELMHYNQHTGLQGGDLIVKEWISPRWMAHIETTPVDYKYWKKIKARINSLRGSFRTFYLWDTIAEYPEEDPTGATFGANTALLNTIGGDNRSVRISGLPATYQLREGDRFSFPWDSGTRTAYHEFAEDTQAVAGLTPLVEVSPGIRAGALTGVTVTILRPRMLARLIPNSAKHHTAGPLQGRITFEAIQVI